MPAGQNCAAVAGLAGGRASRARQSLIGNAGIGVAASAPVERSRGGDGIQFRLFVDLTRKKHSSRWPHGRGRLCRNMFGPDYRRFAHGDSAVPAVGTAGWVARYRGCTSRPCCWCCRSERGAICLVPRPAWRWCRHRHCYCPASGSATDEYGDVTCTVTRNRWAWPKWWISLKVRRATSLSLPREKERACASTAKPMPATAWIWRRNWAGLCAADFSAHARDVLVIGFGSGSTVGASLRFCTRV